MKLFGKKVGPALKWIAGVIITYVLGAILDSIVSKEQFFKSLFKTFPKKIIQLTLPDIMFIIFLIIIILLMFIFYRRIKKDLFKDIKRQIQSEQFDANKFLAERLKDKKLVFKDNEYWLEPINIAEKESKELEGPFCSRCWDEKKELIHLHYSQKKDRAFCPSCHTYGKIK